MTRPAERATGQAPIYDSLIEEHGDVPAEVRAVAEKAQREVARALDWSDLGTHPLSSGASSHGHPPERGGR
ncbi:hypothetical protein IF129_12145 [Streptomyces chumphonensis]|uniref:Uncharacterized protein n=2 Tax=Streptomyces TaxID=1883 RepID=A0A927F0V8_9ACTN|nr:hypothetical protein [Streptomyces chumphonensis]MBD3932301.1 hypothetical protein [Streptomyces chumphonensis]